MIRAMPSPRISSDVANGTYFITCTVKRWYYLFDRHHRWDILADSLTYCREHKQLRLHGFVFMLNHLHLIVSSPDASGFLRDFKRHTSRALHSNILTTEPNIESLFLESGGTCAVWQATNMPILIETEKFFLQKLNYIHENPVRKQYVRRAEDWYWSSANPPAELAVDPVWE